MKKSTWLIVLTAGAISFFLAYMVHQAVTPMAEKLSPRVISVYDSAANVLDPVSDKPYQSPNTIKSDSEQMEMDFFSIPILSADTPRFLDCTLSFHDADSMAQRFQTQQNLPLNLREMVTALSQSFAADSILVPGLSQKIETMARRLYDVRLTVTFLKWTLPDSSIM